MWKLHPGQGRREDNPTPLYLNPGPIKHFGAGVQEKTGLVQSQVLTFLAACKLRLTSGGRGKKQIHSENNPDGGIEFLL